MERKSPRPKPVFTTEAEKQAARVVMDVIGKYEVKRDLVPTSSALLKPEVQKEILAEVAERLKPLQGELLADVDESVPALDLSAVVAKTTEIVVQQTIDIPRIAVVPTGEITTGFHAFKLDVSQLHLQPGQREIVGQMLRTNEQFTLAAEVGLKEQRPEDYIVHALVDFDDIDYFTHAELLYDLAGQMVQHLRGYLSEDEAISVLDRDRRLIAREIHAQMMAHFWEEATEYEVQVSRGFTELKPCNYTATAGQTAHHFRETVTETSRIKQMLFGGFARCLYPLQKFDRIPSGASPSSWSATRRSGSSPRRGSSRSTTSSAPSSRNTSPTSWPRRTRPSSWWKRRHVPTSTRRRFRPRPLPPCAGASTLRSRGERGRQALEVPPGAP